MEKIELKDAFAEFKNQKNIDRPTMMGVLEDVFRTQITKTYGSADNFDIIINIDKGDCEIYWNREVVEEVATMRLRARTALRAGLPGLRRISG